MRGIGISRGFFLEVLLLLLCFSWLARNAVAETRARVALAQPRPPWVHVGMWYVLRCLLSRTTATRYMDMSVPG